MPRKCKTSEKNRTQYIYYTADGTKIVITPGEKGVTEADIELLHSMDDDEVDEQRRYDYRVIKHLDAYHDGDGEEANDRNSYLMDESTNPELVLLEAEGRAEHSALLVQLSEAKESLLP